MLDAGRVRKYIFAFLKISIAVLIILYLFKGGWLTKETFTKLFRKDNVSSIIVSGIFFFYCSDALYLTACSAIKSN